MIVLVVVGVYLAGVAVASGLLARAILGGAQPHALMVSLALGWPMVLVYMGLLWYLARGKQS